MTAKELTMLGKFTDTERTDPRGSVAVLFIDILCISSDYNDYLLVKDQTVVVPATPRPNRCRLLDLLRSEANIEMGSPPVLVPLSHPSPPLQSQTTHP